VRKLRFAIAICLFLVTVAVAVWNDWSTADLVWASWISSVVVGVGLIILGLASLSLLAPSTTGMRYGCAVWFLFLFVVPWSVLQFLIASPINAVFPIHENVLGVVVTWSSRDVYYLANLDLVLHATLAAYWPFVLLSAASEFSRLPSYWRRAGSMSRRGSHPFLLHGQFASAGRMFLFVWLLASLWCGGLTGYSLYPALVFYFFPWDAVSWRTLFGRSQGRWPSRDPDQLVLRFGGGLLSVVGWPCLLAGIFFLSLPMSREGLRGSAIAMITGLVLALVGVVLLLGRFETVIDRRESTLTNWLRLGIIRRRWRHSLKGIGSIKLEPVRSTGEFTAQDGSEKLTVTARDGIAHFYYEVSLTGRGRTAPYLYALSFVGSQKARDLAEEVATFLDVRLSGEPVDTDGPSQAGAEDSAEAVEGESRRTSRRAGTPTTVRTRKPLFNLGESASDENRRIICKMEETEQALTLQFHLTRPLLGKQELGITILYFFIFGWLSGFFGSWLPLLAGAVFVGVLVLGGAIRDLWQVRRPCLVYDKSSDTLCLPRAGREISPARERVALSVRTTKGRARRGESELVAILDGKEEIPVVRIQGQGSGLKEVASRLNELGVEHRT